MNRSRGHAARWWRCTLGSFLHRTLRWTWCCTVSAVCVALPLRALAVPWEELTPVQRSVLETYHDAWPN